MRRVRAAAVVDGAAASTATMRTLAIIGFAAAALFLALTIVALVGGDGQDDTEVLGARAGPPVTDDLEVASTEAGAFFQYAEDPRENIAGSATVIVKGAGDVSLTVAGTPHDDRAVISATVENATAGAIVFEGGLEVTVDITYAGLPWKTVEPADRSVTQLRPGERATVTTEVALDAFGEYELSGEVFFERQ